MCYLLDALQELVDSETEAELGQETSLEPESEVSEVEVPPKEH